MKYKTINIIYKIDKNIPIPTKSNYPFAEMEIGDSFEIDVGEKTTLYISTIVSGAARRFCEKHPLFKFSLRTINEKHIRVWRIENRKESLDTILEEIDRKRKQPIDLNKK